jgi:hypothetical protein
MTNGTQTVADVIQGLGGLEAVAGICGVGQTAVINWRTWNSFPNKADVLLVIQDACRDKGFKIDTSLFSRSAA